MVNDIAWAQPSDYLASKNSTLAPHTRLTEAKFKDDFLTGEFLLSAEGAMHDIDKEIELEREKWGKSWRESRTETINVNNTSLGGKIYGRVRGLDSVVFVKRAGLLASKGQLAFVDLIGQLKASSEFGGLPVVYIDSMYWNTTDKCVQKHEIDEIIQWESFRVNVLHIATKEGMGNWIRKYFTVADPLLEETEYKGMNSCQIAEFFHGFSYPVRDLYKKIADEIDSKDPNRKAYFDLEYIKNMLSMYPKKESKLVNIAAQPDENGVVPNGPSPELPTSLKARALALLKGQKLYTDDLVEVLGAEIATIVKSESGADIRKHENFLGPKPFKPNDESPEVWLTKVRQIVPNHNRNDSNVLLLTPEQEIMLGKEKDRGNGEVVNAFVMANMGLVYNCIDKRSIRPGIDRDQVESNARMALLDAARHWKWFEYRFSTYAVNCIDRRITRLLNEKDIMLVPHDEDSNTDEILSRLPSVPRYTDGDRELTLSGLAETIFKARGNDLKAIKKLQRVAKLFSFDSSFEDFTAWLIKVLYPEEVYPLVPFMIDRMRGWSLEDIGKRAGCSKETVRQAQNKPLENEAFIREIEEFCREEGESVVVEGVEGEIGSDDGAIISLRKVDKEYMINIGFSSRVPISSETIENKYGLRTTAKLLPEIIAEAKREFSFGSRIKSIRIALGWTPEYFAVKVGVSDDLVRSIESGHIQNITQVKIFKIISALASGLDMGVSELTKEIYPYSEKIISDARLQPTIGRKIRYIRETLRLTRGSLSERAGVSCASISSIETKELRHPHKATISNIISALARKLNVDAYMLRREVFSESIKHPIESVPEPIKSSEEIIIEAKAQPTLGLKIKSIRKALGWSQASLAERAKISVNSIILIETGRTQHPSPATISKIISAFATELKTSKSGLISQLFLTIATGEALVPAGSIYSVFKYLCDNDITTPGKALTADELGAKYRLNRKYNTLKYDTRGLYYHLDLIERASGSGRRARYYVPEMVKNKIDRILPTLEPFRSEDLRPDIALLDKIYKEKIQPILEAQDTRLNEARVTPNKQPPTGPDYLLQSRKIKDIKLLAQDIKTKVELIIFKDGSKLVKKSLVKFLGSRRLARWIIRRQFEAISALQGIRGVPELVGSFDELGNAFYYRYIEGDRINRAFPVDDKFFDGLYDIFQAMWNIGLVHNSLCKRNLLVGVNGQPYIIDFETAIRRGSNFLSRWLFNKLQHEDLYHLYKLKLQFKPQLTTPRERKIGSHSSWLRIIYNLIYFKPISFILRLLHKFNDSVPKSTTLNQKQQEIQPILETQPTQMAEGSVATDGAPATLLTPHHKMQLENGAKVVVVGGGPAGSFFAIRLLREARRLGKIIDLTIIEKKAEVSFEMNKSSGAHREGCNYCAGSISPRMNDVLEEIGLTIPDEIIQGVPDAVTVQGDWKNIVLKIPKGRKMVSVYRGSKPRGRAYRHLNFDSFLLANAIREGAHVITGEVTDIKYSDSHKPLVDYRTTKNDNIAHSIIEADFMVFAGGINQTPGITLKDARVYNSLQNLIPGFNPPRIRKALIFELDVGAGFVSGMKDDIYYILYGSKDFKLEMCSLMPKGRFLTVVLIGPAIDESNHSDNLSIIQRFLSLPHIKRLLPKATLNSVCICGPNMVIGGAKNPFADRIAIVGDGAISRLNKDGIFSSYMTSSVLADTILNVGIDKSSLRKNYEPVLKTLEQDNRFGRAVFMINKFVFGHPVLSRILYQAILTERKAKFANERRLENILWRTASGDDTYRSIFISMFHPFNMWLIFTGGVLATVRNYLTERLFGLRWTDFGRYPTGVYREDLEAKREEFFNNLDITLYRPVDFERIYSIRIKAAKDEILRELGRFADRDRKYFKPRMIDIHRVSGNANEIDSIIKYDVLGRLFSVSLILEDIVQGRYLVYRIKDGFAKGGVLIFDVNETKKGDSVLSIYVAFNFPRSSDLLAGPLWYILRHSFPGFMHDVVWNHSLCQLKDIIEANQTTSSSVPVAQPDKYKIAPDEQPTTGPNLNPAYDDEDRKPFVGHTEGLSVYVGKLYEAISRKDYVTAFDTIIAALENVLTEDEIDLSVINFTPFKNNLLDFVTAVYPNRAGPGYEEFNLLLTSVDVLDLKTKVESALPILKQKQQAMRPILETQNNWLPSTQLMPKIPSSGITEIVIDGNLATHEEMREKMAEIGKGGVIFNAVVSGDRLSIGFLPAKNWHKDILSPGAGQDYLLKGFIKSDNDPNDLQDHSWRQESFLFLPLSVGDISAIFDGSIRLARVFMEHGFPATMRLATRGRDMGLKIVTMAEIAGWPLSTESQSGTLSDVAKLVDSLVQEVGSRQAPGWIAQQYRPGRIPISAERKGNDSIAGKIEQAKQHLALATQDPDVRIRAGQALELLSKHPRAPELTILEFEGLAQRLVKLITGNEQAYQEYKEKLDKAVQPIYLQIRSQIFQIPNRKEALRTAMIYAGIVNLLDITQMDSMQEIADSIGLKSDYRRQPPSSADLQRLLDKVHAHVVNEGAIIIDELEYFLTRIEQAPSGSMILYFTDNHGEFIFDQLVIEQLLLAGYKVAVVSRCETVRDDITRDETKAILSSNPNFAAFLADGRLTVTTDGSYFHGADLTQSVHHSDFLDAWHQSIGYIAKGAGNFQSLFGQRLSLPGLYIRMMKKAQNAYRLLEEARGRTIAKRTPYDLALAYQPAESRFEPTVLYTLKDMPEPLKRLYSRCKLGDMEATETFANLLYEKIDEQIGEQISADPEDWVLVAGPYLDIKNNANYIGDLVARRLNIQRVSVSRRRYENGPIYVMSSLSRKAQIAESSLYYNGVVSLTGKKALFIDDCIGSEIIAKTVSKILLQHGATAVIPYIITRIENPTINSEIDLDRTALNIGGLSEILDILKTPKNVIASRMITFLALLKPEEIEYLSNSITPERRRELKLAILTYYGPGEYPRLFLPLMHNIDSSSADTFSSKEPSLSAALQAIQKLSDTEKEALFKKIDARLTEQLAEIGERQALAVANDLLGDTSYFKTKGFDESVLFKAFFHWLQFSGRISQETGPFSIEWLKREAQRLILQMRNEAKESIFSIEEVKRLGLNNLEIPDIGLIVNLGDDKCFMAVNDILRALNTDKRLCFRWEEAFPLTFVYGSASEKTVYFENVDRGEKKELDVVTFKNYDLMSPLASILAGEELSDTVCFIFFPNVAEEFDREINNFKSSGIPGLNFYEFLCNYGDQGIATYEAKKDQIYKEVAEVVEAHEIGHVSHAFSSGISSDDMEALYDGLCNLLRDRSDTKDVTLLMSSLFELMANLAPSGVYRRIFAVAKKDPVKALRMLQFQRFVATGYKAHVTDLARSYHHEWELPILNKLLNDGSEKLVDNLDAILNKDNAFEKINSIFMELIAVVREDASDKSKIIDHFRKAKKSIDGVVEGSAPLNTVYNYRFNYFEIPYVIDNIVHRFEFPVIVDLRFNRMPGYWDGLLITSTADVLKKGEDLLDMTCGQAMVSVALAHMARRAVACDIYPEILKLAERNLQLNKRGNVALRNGDLFEPIGDEKFDVITSNPPAMPTPTFVKDIDADSVLVNEGGPDGRRIIDKLIAGSPKHLNPGGRFVLVHMAFLGYKKTFEAMLEVGLIPKLILEYEIEVKPGDIVDARRDYIEKELGYKFIERDGEFFYKVGIVIGYKPLIERKSLRLREPFDAVHVPKTTTPPPGSTIGVGRFGQPIDNSNNIEEDLITEMEGFVAELTKETDPLTKYQKLLAVYDRLLQMLGKRGVFRGMNIYPSAGLDVLLSAHHPTYYINTEDLQQYIDDFIAKYCRLCSPIDKYFIKKPQYAYGSYRPGLMENFDLYKGKADQKTVIIKSLRQWGDNDMLGNYDVKRYLERLGGEAISKGDRVVFFSSQDLSIKAFEWLTQHGYKLIPWATAQEIDRLDNVIKNVGGKRLAIDVPSELLPIYLHMPDMVLIFEKNLPSKAEIAEIFLPYKKAIDEVDMRLEGHSNKNNLTQDELNWLRAKRHLLEEKRDTVLNGVREGKLTREYVERELGVIESKIPTQAALIAGIINSDEQSKDGFQIATAQVEAEVQVPAIAPAEVTPSVTVAEHATEAGRVDHDGVAPNGPDSATTAVEVHAPAATPAEVAPHLVSEQVFDENSIPFDVIDLLLNSVPPTQENRFGDKTWKDIAPLQDIKDKTETGWISIYVGGPKSPRENIYTIAEGRYNVVEARRGIALRDYDEEDRTRFKLFLVAIKKALANFEEIRKLAQEKDRADKRDIAEVIPAYTGWAQGEIERRSKRMLALRKANESIGSIPRNSVSVQSFFNVMTCVYRIFWKDKYKTIRSFDDINHSRYSNKILLEENLLRDEQSAVLTTSMVEPRKIYIDMDGYQKMGGNSIEFSLGSMLYFINDPHEPDRIRIRIDPRYFSADYVRGIETYVRLYELLVENGIPVEFPENFERLYLGEYNIKYLKDPARYPLFGAEEQTLSVKPVATHDEGGVATNEPLLAEVPVANSVPVAVLPQASAAAPTGIAPHLVPEKIFETDRYLLQAVDYFNNEVVGSYRVDDMPPLTREKTIDLYELFRGDRDNPEYNPEERCKRLESLSSYKVITNLANSTFNQPEDVLKAAVAIYAFIVNDQIFVGKPGFDTVLDSSQVDRERSHPANGHHRLAWFVMNYFLIRNGYSAFYFTDKKEYIVKAKFGIANLGRGDDFTRTLKERVIDQKRASPAEQTQSEDNTVLSEEIQAEIGKIRSSGVIKVFIYNDDSSVAYPMSFSIFEYFATTGVGIIPRRKGAELVWYVASPSGGIAPGTTPAATESQALDAAPAEVAPPVTVTEPTTETEILTDQNKPDIANTLQMLDKLIPELEKKDGLKYYTVKYNVTKILQGSPVESLLKMYVEKVLPIYMPGKDRIKLTPSGANSQSLISVECYKDQSRSGQAIGESYVDVDEDISGKALRLIGMLNMALVAAHIPKGISADEMSRYDNIISFIKQQYKEISGEELTEDIFNDTAKGIWIKLPHAAQIPLDKVSEYYRLTTIQLEQAA